MDLTAINLEQLGTAGVTVAILLYFNFKLSKERDAEREERKFWQQTAFDASRDAQKELFSAVQTFKEVAESLKE